MYKVGQPYSIDGITYVPTEEFRHVETGVASWYGPGFHGKNTANGETYDQHDRTAATEPCRCRRCCGSPT
jgi:rare lipoprotein A